jgi:hypothetical protein
MRTILWPRRLVPTAVAASVALMAIPGGLSPKITHAAAGPLITDVTPSARSNTLYAEQPLSATITDTVPVTSVSFTLRDLTAGTAAVVPDATAPGATEAVTVPAQMTPGHAYSIAVTAVDAMGGTTVADQGTDPAQGFLAVSASAASTTVTVASSPGSVARTTGTWAVADFPSVPVDVVPSQVLMSGTQHAGFGYVQLTPTPHLLPSVRHHWHHDVLRTGNLQHGRARAVATRDRAPIYDEYHPVKHPPPAMGGVPARN